MPDILKVKINDTWRGIPAIKGDKGDKGDAGTGIPSGGTSGQVLKKKSATDYDFEWGTLETKTKLSEFTDDLGSSPTHTHSQYEVKSNKTTTVSASSTDEEYPTSKCLYTMLGNVETLLSNL